MPEDIISVLITLMQDTIKILTTITMPIIKDMLDILTLVGIGLVASLRDARSLGGPDVVIGPGAPAATQGGPTEVQVGARLKGFSRAWRGDPWAHRVIRNGLKVSWLKNLPPKIRTGSSQRMTPALRKYVREMLDANVIVHTTQKVHTSRIFSVKRKDSKKDRVILNIKRLNRRIVCPRFKMLSIQDLRMMLPRRAYLASIDLKEAYYHVPISRGLQRYLAFRVGDHSYKFRAMPFGLNVAPWTFTRLTKAVLKPLRQRGFFAAAYLDDWIVWGRSMEEAKRGIRACLRELRGRGFLINWKKSSLLPSRKITYLGVEWDTNRSTIKIPQETQKRALNKLELMLSSDLVSCRQIESLVGLLNFIILVTPRMRPHLQRLLAFVKYRIRREMRDDLFKMPARLRRHLTKWKEFLPTDKAAKWRNPTPSLTLFTDASDVGWGFHTSEKTSGSGRWGKILRNVHINIRELVAVWLSLKRLVLPENSTIRLFSDNQTVVHVLKKMGSARSVPLRSWALSIGSLLSRKRWYIVPHHLAGVLNVRADLLSRGCPVPTEWTLDDASFRWLEDVWGPFEVDLFATEENKKLQTFASPYPHPEAVGQDALALDWNRWRNIYLFPPKNLLPLVVKKLADYQGSGVLVAPDWPLAKWYIPLKVFCQEPVLIQDQVITQEVGGLLYQAPPSSLGQLHAWAF